MRVADSQVLESFSGLPSVTLTTADSSRAVVLLHGGHVVSWCPSGRGEQLYLSPKSKFQAGSAVRGGVPVIFPQFAERGPGVRHGFARTQEWRVVEVESGSDRAHAVLQLDSTAATRALWPHDFALELRVQIQGTELELTLSCRNPGTEALEFSSALHTYLAVSDVRHACVSGLQGLEFWDSVRGEPGQVHSAPLRITGEVDRIYAGVSGAIELVEGKVEDRRGSQTRSLRLEQQGFEDAVVWNPGPEKCASLGDMPADGFLRMLCIEAAQVGRLVTLAPGEEWQGRQILRVV